MNDLPQKSVAGLSSQGAEGSLSLGESRVRTSFNPSQTSTVDAIKQKSAELINLCSTLNKDNRLSALAMTGYEDACMWAVKAATA